MFEVIAFGDGGSLTSYKGDNWLLALTSYHNNANVGNHVQLWEGDSNIKEFHPELGYMEIN